MPAARFVESFWSPCASNWSWAHMTLKELVKGKKVHFKFYRDSELWYETDDGFEFPVPIADTGSGIFNAEDNAIAFMRWIRRHVAERAEWDKEREAQARNLSENAIESENQR